MTTITSKLLLAWKNKWGWVVGLFSQPFWWYATISSGQWGLIVTSIFYTLTWAYGAYLWFKEDRLNDEML